MFNYYTIVICAIILQILSVECHLKYKQAKSVVIDHDGGADDSMAIFITLLYEKYFNGPKVVAIMTSHGNVDEDQVFINTQSILSVADRQDIPIYRGSNRSIIAEQPSDGFFGKDGLGDTSLFKDFESLPAEPEHASVALVRLSKEYKGDLTVISLGALTNLALAVIMDPDFIGRLEKLTIGAGNIHSEDFPDPEFNAMMDVEAYHVVVASSSPDIVSVVPFSQVYLNITKDWRINVLGAIDTQLMKAQNAFEAYSLKNSKSDMWRRLDPLAAAITLDRSLVRDASLSLNDIILCGENRGIDTNLFEGDEFNVELIKTVYVEEYKNFLINVFSFDL